ncbi:MAG: hypothetical protein GY913_03420 [Proteobacteria bacterium]|nr:hypothetical protein [Pseudomonadota bacterium]MCP4915950.1 hypothetical protein [Pseudomonadota bacterium]
MILWVSIAFAADLAEPESAEIARLFYRQTGRTPPEAFLADDIDALIESGHSAEELTGAVVWIARNVPGAESYTLAGILDSHLANALVYEEELVLPEGFDPDEVLGEAHVCEAGWLAGPGETKEFLEHFYTSTGRVAPSPPTDEDLAGFAVLAQEGWTETGVRTLVDWVPENVRGVEELTWGQVAGLAADKGYLSGPRPSGDMEELEGVTERMPPPRTTWVTDRDPMGWDGGHARSMASMTALQADTHRAAVAARLPGMDLRTIEVRADAFDAHPSGAITAAQADASSGWVLELGYGATMPGRAWTSPALDGGPVRPDTTLVTGQVLHGRASAGHTLSEALSGVPAAIGAGVWGYRALGQAEAGATASLGFGDQVQLIGHGSLGGIRQEQAGEQVAGQVASLDVIPRVELGGGWIEGHARGYWRSGGLADDAPPIYDDDWSERRAGFELRAGFEQDRYRLAGGAQAETGEWSLTWVERIDTDARTRHADELGLGQVWLGGEANVWETLWITGGARVLGGDDPGFELGAGARMNLKELGWLGVYGRVGHTPAFGLQLGLPV